MRILPIALSVLMIFAPAYSAYASVLPSKGQIIAIGKKGGAMIKTSGGGIVKGGAIGIGIEGARIGIGAAVSWCKNNQKKCKDKIGDIAELACDDMECIVEHPDTPDEQQGQCKIYFKVDGQYIDANTAYTNRATQEDRYLNSIHQLSPHDEAYDWIQRQEHYYNNISQSKPTTYRNFSNPALKVNVTHKDSQGESTGQKSVKEVRFYAYVLCAEQQQDKDKRLSDDELGELAKKIGENMDDDDIINYYNTDYGDIIINNKRYDGDDINSQTNIDNRCNNNSCNEISQEIEQDVRSKKYDIDDVNEQNCTMDKAKRKYIQCSFDFENGHDNTQDNTNKDDTSKDTKPEKDEPPLCNTSDFFREACEYFDWVDDEADTKQDKKVDVEDEEEDPLDKEKINIRGVCPADEQIALTMPWGYSTTIVFTYKPYCDFARSIKPYMTATGAIVSMYIVGSCGRRL